MAETAVLDLTLSDDEDDSDDSQCSNYASSTAQVKNESQRQPDPTPALAPQFNNEKDAPKLTIVNGKGFWRSWTRSFKTTMLKLLDLIDNSVDGATIQERPGFTGRVHIYPDVHEQLVTNRKGSKFISTTGLCIRNNSPHKIVPLSEALVVHNTTKVDPTEIGENGVGLKQACAALCDLSFVLVKNGSDANIEMGIVAKSLQREEGPYLPAFQFSNEEGQESLREQMITLFSEPKHEDVAQCIAQYGANITGCDPSLSDGIDGLCKRVGDMCHLFYGSDYVFEVILNKIRHGQEEGLVKRALDLQQKITVNQLIKDLRREIPRTYLHIPDSFQFIVDEERLKFNYWQKRLVELSTFTIPIGSTIPWKQNFEVSDQHPDSYELRLFMGFDRFRIADADVDGETGEKTETKNASLYFYSRQSGRLIKSDPDARAFLGLTSGGTAYCQGLTIIIDDINGCLPLHPTKQDISFGLENKGDVHEENLVAWVGSVTKFYYSTHVKKFNNLKKVLTAKVSHYVDSKLPNEPKALSESDFTTFKMTFGEYRSKIQVDSKKSKEIVGRDTYFRLHRDCSIVNEKKRSHNSSQKKPCEDNSDDQPSLGEPQKKRRRGEPISHREDADSDADSEANVKMEAAAANNSIDNGSACIDLCGSSDEDDGRVPAERPSHPTETNRILELEKVIKQLRDESKSEISSLRQENKALQERWTLHKKQLEDTKTKESKWKALTTKVKKENKELKEQVEQKDRIISVLKRRLGA
mmetsp:Transcript_9335/g.20219  ORF Transcript_9335/g.20219 Transcript_9335/m.20219 type:complete len:754 (-) Transcript_9335:1826-4087(-)